MRMSRRSGFSMIEMLMTLIIIGIITLMAVPKLDLSHMKSDAALRQVASLFVQAQRTALAKQYNVLISIDVPGNRMRLVEDRNNSSTFDAGDRAMWMALEPGTKFYTSPLALDGMSGTVALVRPRTIDGYPSIIFRRNGAASTDAAVFFTTKVTDPGSMRAVEITQSTGRADPYKYTGSAWVRAGA
jgi:prepilin-type N-terminal cleavage/methylation domain-containing protein